MQIERLVLHQYRNIENLSLDAHPRFNVIHGRNGQGKTNVLESIYLAGTLKSFRGARNAELIQFDRTEGAVRAVVQKRELKQEILVQLRGNGKHVELDGKKVRNLQETFGKLNVVVFSPEDLAISKGSASGRRTFLDRAIFQILPGYALTNREYENALKNRNALIKDMKTQGKSQGLLDVFDPQVIALGAKVTWQRLQFLKTYRPFFLEAYESLSSGEQHPEVVYQSDLGLDEDSDLKDIENRLSAAFAKDRGRDLARGYTTHGPHADDLNFFLDGKPARTFASQGQHRSIVLSLKMAEIQHLGKFLDFQPVLLLDDVSSELDRKRNGQLMAFLHAHPGQIFISTTDPAHLSIDSERMVSRMDEGQLKEVEVVS